MLIIGSDLNSSHRKLSLLGSYYQVHLFCCIFMRPCDSNNFFSTGSLYIGRLNRSHSQEPCNYEMDCRSHIYLFDDQKSEELSSSSFFDQCGKDEAFSRIFCQRAYLEIRSQLENNGHHERLGRFSSFQDLVSLNSNHQMLPSLKPALICAFQLGKFIRQVSIICS